MSSTKTSNPSILDQFTPEVLGIFWITEEELTRTLPGFDEFNYLFDGLISQYIYGLDKTTDKHAHIFFTENFHNRIFLAHLNTKGLPRTKIAGDIDEQISLITASKNEKRMILVLDQSAQGWPPELIKRYPQFEFRELILN